MYLTRIKEEIKTYYIKYYPYEILKEYYKEATKEEENNITEEDILKEYSHFNIYNNITNIEEIPEDYTLIIDISLYEEDITLEIKKIQKKYSKNNNIILKVNNLQHITPINNINIMIVKKDLRNKEELKEYLQ